MSVAVAAGVLVFAPDDAPSFTVFDLPLNATAGGTEFPGAEPVLPEGVPLAPLLSAAQPETLGMIAPQEGVTRVTRGDVVQFRFNRPMVRASAVGRPLAESPVPLEPVSGRGVVPGTATWTSRSTLTFVPAQAAFDVNMEARVGFSEALTSLEGEVLYDDEAERLIVLDGTPRVVRNDSRVSAGEPLALYFSSAVRAAELREQVLVYESGGGSRSIPFDVRTPARAVGGDDEEPLHRVELMPRRPLAPGSRIGVAIAPAYLSWGGDVPGYYSFSVQPRPRFTGLGCTVSDYGTAGCAYTESPGEIIDIGAELILLASHPLAATTVASVTVRPPLPGLEVEIAGEGLERARHLVVRGEWDPQQVYEVRVGTLVTEAAERVTSPGPLAIRSQGHAPEVHWATGTHVFERAARAELPFTGIALADAVLHVRPIAVGEEAAAVLHPAEFVSASGNTLPLAPLAPTSRANRWGRGVVTLEDAGDLAVVGISATRDSLAPVATAIVQRTDLGLSAVASDDGVTVWVTSIANGTPIAEARVSAWGSTGLEVGAGSTDEHGVAFVRVAGGSALLDSIVLAAGTSDDRAILRLDPGSAVTGSGLGLAGGAPAWASNVHATVMSDRGVYRPGERVRALGFVRRVEGGNATLAGALPVSLRFWDPAGEVPFATIDGTLDDRGVVDADIELPDPAPMGPWRAELVQRDASHTRLGEATFSVAEYREPRLRVDIVRDPSPRPDGALVAGQTVEATLRARYLFGTPVTEGEIDWQITRESAAPMPSRWSELTFGPTGVGVRYQVLAEGTLDLDPASASAPGEVRISAPLEMSVARRTRFSISADASDASGESAATTSSFVVYPGEHELGMRRLHDWVSLGTSLAAELVAIDHDGEPAIGVPIEVRVVREGWHGWWEWHGAEETGALQLRRAAQAETVATCALQSASEPVRCEHTPARPGTYRLVASTRDGVITDQRVYVAGPNESPDRDPPGAPIALTPERSDYRAGETARVAFESPWPQAHALLTVTQAGVTHREVRTVGAGGQVFEVPLTEAMVPNTHVALVLVRARTAEPTPTSDLGAPDLRFGAAELLVQPATSQLSVSIEHGGAGALGEARAGTSVEVAVQVRDAAGAPVRNAEVALWAVDEGTLRISGYHAPSPTEGFFVRRAPALALEDLRRLLVSRLPGGLEPGPSGDGGYEDSASSLESRERYEPTILWQPRLRTDADGRVTSTIALPERLTEYRVMAVALDQGASAGMASSRLTATRPLVARPALPRFVTDGDEVGARVFVNNRQTTPVHARVVLSLAGDDGATREVGTAELELGPESEQAVTLPVRVTGTRVARFTMHVEGGGESFDVVRELPVVPRGYFARHSTLVAGEGARALTVQPPEGVEVGRLRATVASHPFLHGAALVDRVRDSWWQSTGSDAALVIAAAANARLGRHTGEVTHERRERDAAVAAAVRRLVSRQSVTGGFGWYAADAENSQATVLAAFALVEASAEGQPPIAEGVVVSPRARELAIERIVRLVRDGELQYYGPEAMEDQALALRLLTSVGRGNPGARDAAFARRQFASPVELAHLAMAYERSDAQRVTLALEASRRLLDPAPSDPHFTQSARAIGIVTEAASSASGARRAMRGLLARLIEVESGASPTELAWVLRAQASVAEGLARSGEGGLFSAAATQALSLDGQSLDTMGGPSPLTSVLRYEVPFARVTGAAHQLEARGRADVPVFLALDGEWAVPLGEPERVARGRGVTVHRVLETEQGTALADGARVQIGSLVRVRLFVFSESGVESALAVRDPHAAGLEPIDAGQRSSPGQALAALLGMSPNDDVTDARGALAMRTSSYVQHVAHDVHASTFYLTRLGPSLSELTYGVRASALGTFTVPPTELASERDPALVARSAMTTLVVEP